MDLQIFATHKETDLDFILHITEYHYTKGYPGSGPTYSCGGTPPEPAEAYPIEGWVELDGDVNSIVDITSTDMDVILLMTNDNQALFDLLCEQDEDGEQKVYDAIVEHAEEAAYEAMAERYADRDNSPIPSIFD